MDAHDFCAAEKRQSYRGDRHIKGAVFEENRAIDGDE